MSPESQVSATSAAAAAPVTQRRLGRALLVGLVLLLSGTGGYVLVEQKRLFAAAQLCQIASVARAKAGIAQRWLGERERDIAALLARGLC